VVEWDDASDAIHRWLALETARSASERTGVPETTIKAWIKSEGLSKGGGSQVRLSREAVDELIEKHRINWEKRRRGKDGE
jgi:excisionase family DNA binding protein